MITAPLNKKFVKQMKCLIKNKLLVNKLITSFNFSMVNVRDVPCEVTEALNT